MRKVVCTVRRTAYRADSAPPLTLCPAKRRCSVIDASGFSTWAATTRRCWRSRAAAMAGRVRRARASTRRRSTATSSTDTPLRQRQSPSRMHRLPGVAGGRGRTGCRPKRRRTWRSDTSRCGRSDISGMSFPRQFSGKIEVAEGRLQAVHGRRRYARCVALFVVRLIEPFRSIWSFPDPDDLIFPRAATRVGPKYQVGALPVPGDDPLGEPAANNPQRIV